MSVNWMTNLAIFFLVGAASLMAAISSQAQPAPSNVVRIMSFNIRYGTANDGENHWKHRQAEVVKVIRELDPDLLGTQETLDFQADYLKEHLPHYNYVGRSRQADAEGGEQCGIFYRKSRFDRLAEGHFWLSETPTRPGSKSWDSSLPRMATWLHLWDRKAERSLYVLNTHFDHRGSEARLKSARLIHECLSELPHGPQPMVVTGDFNSGVGSPPYQALFSEQAEVKLIDTYSAIPRVIDSPEGTFGGFRGETDGARIDWIGCSPAFQVLSADIVTRSYDGRYPSDHYPVTAQLRYRESAD